MSSNEDPGQPKTSKQFKGTLRHLSQRNRNFCSHKTMASQVALLIKSPSANAGDIRVTGSIPGLGRSPRGRHSNPLQYSGLENSMDCRVHGAAKISQI